MKMGEYSGYKLVLSIDNHDVIGITVSAWAAPSPDMREVSTVSQKIFLNNYRDFFPDTIESHHKLFQVLDEISDESLTARFGAKIRNGDKLSVLMGDEKIKAVLKHFIEKKIDFILRQLVENDIVLCINIFRKAYIADHCVDVSSTSSMANISLKKSDTSVSYKLNLISDEQDVALMDKNIMVVCNHPAWAIIDRKLYQPVGINGNMLLPFATKNVVIVPDKLVHTYFKSFVLKLDSSVEIEAEGFDIDKYDIPENPELQLTESVFEGKFVLKLACYYHEQKFEFHDIRQGRKKIEISPEGNIRILNYVRNMEAERHIAEKLTECGLEKTAGQVFVLPEQSVADMLDACLWLRKNKPALVAAGFKVAPFFMGENPVNLEAFDVKTVAKEAGDWFDVHVVVNVGEFSFPFKKLAANIRKEDPVFMLPDGSVFIIPKAWFEKYSSLVQLGTETESGYRLSKAQATVAEELTGVAARLSEQNEAEIPLPEGLNAVLRPYQEAGFRWLARLYDNNLGACLADDMGLGKTLQSIALLLYISSKKSKIQTTGLPSGQLDLFAAPQRTGIRALVVLPASLVFNWYIELEKFAPQLSKYTHTGTERYRSHSLIGGFDLVLTTYHILVRDIDELSKIAFDAIILDESQQIKNKDSKMFGAVNRISAPFHLTLTGTPIENSLADLWAQMQFINPGMLGSAQSFKQAFRIPIERNQDEAKREELLRIVKPFILRRTKKSVTPELPELTEFVHYCEMDEQQAEIYEKEKSAVRNSILMAETDGSGKEKLRILNALQRLRQIASHPAMLPEFADVASGKFDEVSYFLENAVQCKEKVLVFSSYVRHLDKYCDWATSNKVAFSRLTGDVALAQRQREVENFQEKDIPWFFLSLKAGGTGLNLTAAELVFLIDPWWNPAAEQQAIARAHRIGQNRNVTAIRFITRNTIEEKILRLQQKKQKLASEIITEDEFFFSLDKSELAGLLE